MITVKKNIVCVVETSTLVVNATRAIALCVMACKDATNVMRTCAVDAVTLMKVLFVAPAITRNVKQEIDYHSDKSV